MSGSAQLDVAQVDGPHSPERTVAAARLIPDAVRFLNYATRRRAGVEGPPDVDEVLGAIQDAAGGLQQTFSQLVAGLREDLATGRLRLDAGRLCADDPARAVEIAVADVATARSACRRLQVALRDARRITAGMYLEDPDG